MKNIELIVDMNKDISDKKSTRNNKIMIKHKKSKFDFDSLTKIISELNGIFQKFNYSRNKIIFDFEPFSFQDKLSYIIFECLIYDLIKNHNLTVDLRMDARTNCIITGGNRNSLITSLSRGMINNKQFVINFEKEKSVLRNKYRRIIKSEEKEDSTVFCILMSDIKSMLKYHCDNSNYISEIAEVITELASNAWEHSKSDCLIDLDICDNYTKRSNDPNQKYCGINIAVINFSNILLGDNLKKKLLTYNLAISNPRYKQVSEAYNNHKNFFSIDYNEDHFFSIASFQNKVSGRIDTKQTGGTGLPKLIRSLEKQAENHFCYVISGNNAIKLDMDYLESNKENWIGFNKSKDFINDIPDINVINHSDLFIPGTAFNLHFIMENIVKMEG